jgi:histidinol-phosphate phosphatase family protein
MGTSGIVFLDRDGVINEDSPAYIKSPDEFHFISGSPEAIALLWDHGFDIILITNQSAIGRNMISVDTLEAIFDRLKAGVAEAGGAIKDIFYCPHAPDEGCDCRKPAPGLIWRAVEKYGIDPASAVMVGDSAKDIQCGRAVGCGKTVLVATGNGPAARAALAEKGMAPDHYSDDLLAAARWIIANC